MSEEFGIEFDPSYSELEFTLAKYDSQSDPLNTSATENDINWYSVREQASELLTRCFDLRVVLWLMRANLHIEGVSAFYLSITEIDRKYAQEGGAIFPQADSESETESVHAAAMGWLATSSCLQEIKNSQVYPGSAFTTEALLTLRTDEQEGKSPHFSEVVKVFDRADAYFADRNMPPLKEQLTLAVDALERVEKFANIQAEDYRLECQQVHDYLKMFSRLLISFEQPALPAEADETEPETSTPEASAVISGKSLRSRQEVILLLDRVLDYFQNYEPSHPAPILIRRSQKMIGMDFATIVEELLPESLASLNKLSGQ